MRGRVGSCTYGSVSSGWSDRVASFSHTLGLRFQLFRGLFVCDSSEVRLWGPYKPTPPKTQWRLVIEENGSRRSVCFNSEQEALTARASLRVHAADPMTQSLTVGQAIEEYIAEKERDCAPISVSTVQDRLERFLPLDTKLRCVDEALAQRIYDSEVHRVTKRQRPVAAATHRATLRTTKEFWRWLLARKYVNHNPWTQVQPVGRLNHGKPQPTIGQAQKLESYLVAGAMANEGKLALLLQLYCGLRSGEVLALQVRDIEQIVIAGEPAVSVCVERGKTKNARRAVRIPPRVATLLLSHIKGRPAQQRVFAADRPAPPKGPWLHKRLALYCEELGLPQYCPHSLRGLNATIALEGGATMEAVARVLGHSSPAVTAKHYAKPDSVLNARLRKIAEVLSSAAACEVALESEEAAVSAAVGSLSPLQLALLRKVLLLQG